MADFSAGKAYRRAGGLAVMAAAAAVGLAACGGSGSPQVARPSESGSHGAGTAAIIEAPGNTSPATGRTDPGTPTTSPAKGGGTTGPTTTTPTSNATQLLDEWAACMRAHGDPDQVDPTVDANKDIDITISPSIQGGYDGYSGEYGSGGPGVSCRSYLTAAQIALGGTPNAKPDGAKLLKFSECMRANGFPDFPDPSGGNLLVPIGGELTPKNPAFKSASKSCADKAGTPRLGNGTPPPGTVRVDGLGSPGSTVGPNSGVVADG